MKKVLLINDTSNECHIGSYNVIQNIHHLCRNNDMKVVESLTRHSIQIQFFQKLKTQ